METRCFRKAARYIGSLAATYPRTKRTEFRGKASPPNLIQASPIAKKSAAMLDPLISNGTDEAAPPRTAKSDETNVNPEIRIRSVSGGTIRSSVNARR